MAVALNYGVFRRKEVNSTAKNIMFYDMGSQDTTVSVVAFQTIKTKERGYSETHPNAHILGVGWVEAFKIRFFFFDLVSSALLLTTRNLYLLANYSFRSSYDRNLGGTDLQVTLREYLADEFNKMGKTKTDVRSVPRAMGKIMKEAGRVKTVLSANSVTHAQVFLSKHYVHIILPYVR